MMLEGRISKLDIPNRRAVIEDAEGREIQVSFPERMNVEISEPETMGNMGGELEDLEVGFLVEYEVESEKEDGTQVCGSVVCIS
ncbi:MAG: hypothetical protein V3S29_01485 [bacterium]